MKLSSPSKSDEVEREAIAIELGGVPIIYASAFAHLQAHAPPEVPIERWHQFINDAGIFLDQWGCEAERLGWRAEELFQESTGSIHRLRQLQADLAAAGVPEEDADWRLWVAFVQLACSALVGVGQPRAGKMINRLVDELNSKSAIELLNALHPSRKAGVLPDDFRYDTDREIHPLAPNNWAL